MSSNSPNPLVPQGSLQHQTKAKSNVRVAIFSIVAIHAVLIVGVLIQGGCKRDEPKVAEPPLAPTIPANDPGYYTSTNELAPAVTPTPAVATNPPTSVPPAVDPLAPIPGTVPPPSVAVPTVVEPIPAPMAPAADAYVVQKGDSFYSIAKKLRVSTKAIADANPNVDSARLKIGQKLNVPAAAAPAATAAVATADAAVAGTTTYTVKSGDNLYKIATKHGTTVKAIQAANNLKTTRIDVGQKLKVPVKASSAPVAAPAPETALPPAGVPVISPVPAPAPIQP